ncbi:metal-dependent hydrolase, partial [Planctomycetota bacterium]|nr:metal-dependent hydrolase [Planctomycetota bacterium]
MDPLSQAVVGAVVAGCVAKPQTIKPALMLGAIAGMAPDLDVFIRDPQDPLLFLEYHRQFTHALAFIPVGAA